MQTFINCQAVAKSKNVSELFDKSNNFMKSEKPETSSAGDQLVRNTLADENDKGAVSFPAASFKNRFLSNPKKLNSQV